MKIMRVILFKTYYHHNEGERILFSIIREETGPYECDIEIQNPGNIVAGTYRREFPVEKFHWKHFRNFRKKFARETEYRQQYRVS